MNECKVAIPVGTQWQRVRALPAVQSEGTQALADGTDTVTAG